MSLSLIPLFPPVFFLYISLSFLFVYLSPSFLLLPHPFLFHCREPPPQLCYQADTSNSSLTLPAMQEVVGEIYDEDDNEEYAVDSRDISR